MKCNIVPLRQNWRDWELHHNKSNGYYSTHFTFSLSLCYSLFLSLSTSFHLFYFYSLAVQAQRGLHTQTRTQTHIYIVCIVGQLQIYSRFAWTPCPEKPNQTHKQKSLHIYQQIHLNCIRFQLPGLNLKANEIDAFLCCLLHL